MTKSPTARGVKSAFTNLNDREQRIIMERIAGRTLREVASDLELKSTGHLHKLETDAWDHLRSNLAFVL